MPTTYRVTAKMFKSALNIAKNSKNDVLKTVVVESYNGRVCVSATDSYSAMRIFGASCADDFMPKIAFTLEDAKRIASIKTPSLYPELTIECSDLTSAVIVKAVGTQEYLFMNSYTRQPSIHKLFDKAHKNKDSVANHSFNASYISNVCKAVTDLYDNNHQIDISFGPKMGCSIFQARGFYKNSSEFIDVEFESIVMPLRR